MVSIVKIYVDTIVELPVVRITIDNTSVNFIDGQMGTQVIRCPPSSFSQW